MICSWIKFVRQTHLHCCIWRCWFSTIQLRGARNLFSQKWSRLWNSRHSTVQLNSSASTSWLNSQVNKGHTKHTHGLHNLAVWKGVSARCLHFFPTGTVFFCGQTWCTSGELKKSNNLPNIPDKHLKTFTFLTTWTWWGLMLITASTAGTRTPWKPGKLPSYC